MSKFLNKTSSELEAFHSLDKLVKSKLSTLQGVFIPVCLSIWGVITFLRFPFIIGQTGIVVTLIMFSFSYLITSFTSLSLSAISTNGTVKGGGPYYLISRSLGPEFGGSIGLIFYFGTILSAAMSLFGFVESMIANVGIKSGSIVKILPETRPFMILYSSIVLLVCLCIALIGTKMFARASIFLALVLLVSTMSILCSLFLRQPFTVPELNVNFSGWNVETLKSNLWSDFANPGLEPIGFKQIFAVVFPACTGILAGASMSGDLKNPSRSIPIGTLSAVGFTFVLYIFLGIGLAGSVERVSLKGDLAIMQDIAAFPGLVTLGILATTFFSSLGSLVGAAKILQAIAEDELVYFLDIFKESESDEECRGLYSLLATWLLLQFLIVAITDIDEIATFVTMFSLLTFGVLNLACFLLRLTGSVNFRPSFSYFNWKTAAVGMILCFLLMFYIDQLVASLSCLIMLSIFIFIHYTAPPKAWGDVMQSLIYHQVRKYLLRLDSRKAHVKFWRPQILLLVHSPQNNISLIRFMNDLKKGGLFVLGHILKGDFAYRLNDYKRQLPGWLRFVDIGRIKAFVELSIAKTERIGAQNLISGSGLGGLKPNIVVMGFFDLSSKKHLVSDSNEDTSTEMEAKISSSTWSRLPEPVVDSRTPSPLRPALFKSKAVYIDTASMAQEIQKDPLCAELPHAMDVEIGINPENYVGIIEDALTLNKSIAIARNFEFLEMQPSQQIAIRNETLGRRKNVFKKITDEYKRLSSVFDRSHHAAFGERSPLLPSRLFQNVDANEIQTSNDNVSVRYIDLWPIQIAEAHSKEKHYSYSFDTYTLVLQMGCILHMHEYWKEEYQLRVIVFVENKKDAKDEQDRIEILLKGLRINAIIKAVWLNEEDKQSDSEEYEKQKYLYEQQCKEATSSQSTPQMRRSTLLSTPVPHHVLRRVVSMDPLPLVEDKQGHFSLFNRLTPMTQFTILNQLMRRHSSSVTTGILFTTLPAPELGTSNHRDLSLNYLEQVDSLSRDLPPCILIHGKGLTVTTSL